jgi:hypothetical protein
MLVHVKTTGPAGRYRRLPGNRRPCYRSLNALRRPGSRVNTSEASGLQVDAAEENRPGW